MKYVEAMCVYRHYKGGLYYVIGVAEDHETLDQVVVYHSVEGCCDMFVRPLKDFLSTAPDGSSQTYRFERIETI